MYSKKQNILVSKVRDSGAQTPALDRAIALLEYISEQSRPVTQAELRIKLGFSANLVFRLTKALVHHGYLERIEPEPHFILTPKLLSLAQPKYEGKSLTQLALKPMQWLRDNAGESSHLGIKSGFECIVLDRIIGPNLYKCYVDVGARGPLHAGAPGKVMLAWLPPDELEDILSKEKLVALTSHTITSPKALITHLAEVRKNGYAMDLDETLEGNHCLGAPVFNAKGQVFASIWITAPSSRLGIKDGKRLAPLVIEAANRVSNALKIS